MRIARSRVRELAVMVLIACAVVALVLLYADRGPVAWMPSARWWGLAGITGLMLWHSVVNYRRHWRRPLFWLHVGLFTALHLIAWVAVLTKATEWPLLWFVPAGVVETAALIFLLHKLGYGLGS